MIKERRTSTVLAAMCGMACLGANIAMADGTPVAAPSSSSILYIRAGAGGTTCADWANACPTLPRDFRRGVTYYIAAGQYLPVDDDFAFRLDAPAQSGMAIVIKKATAADHGTNDGWQAAYAAGAATFSRMLEINSSNWVIDGQAGGSALYRWQGDFGFRFVSTAEGDAMIRIGWDSLHGVPVSGISNIAIRHAEIVGMGQSSHSGGGTSNDGLAVYGATDVTLSSFRMHGIGRCPFFLSGQNIVIEHGWVESFYTGDTHAELASIWGFADTFGDVTFRDNLFTDIQSTGGIMWSTKENPSARLRIYGNTFYRLAGSTWPAANGLIGGWTAEAFSNVTVYNNNFVNVDQASLSNAPQIHANNHAYDNLFYDSQAPDFSSYDSHDDNLFIRAGDAQAEPSGVAIADGTDPFVDAAHFDFRLKAPTWAGLKMPPAYDGKDPFGQQRGGDGNWDRGAFEYRQP